MSNKRQWLKPLARAGYASRGVVYLIVGAFAFLSAFGPSDHKDSKGALLTLLQQPFGQALVLLMVIGLLGYVGWRLVQSLLDTDDHGWSPKGIVVRGGLLASAATHAVLALYALSLLYPTITGASADRGDNASLADRISAVAGMTPVLLVLCVAFAGTAIAHWYKAATHRACRMPCATFGSCRWGTFCWRRWGWGWCCSQAIRSARRSGGGSTSTTPVEVLDDRDSFGLLQ